jgi:rhodanese-related sulfurtransferase
VTYRDLNPTDADAELRRDRSLRILDVRTPREHRSHRLPGATLIPVQDLALRIGELDPAESWLVHCEHGVRSQTACAILRRAGFTRIANLAGGLANWMAAGLPVER